jgi:hypothetical protein
LGTPTGGILPEATVALADIKNVTTPRAAILSNLSTCMSNFSRLTTASNPYLNKIPQEVVRRVAMKSCIANAVFSSYFNSLLYVKKSSYV